ncbi:Ig-like domain repeat protein, partial [bacterium]|nr:Ig-like domain repeat protein [bacterium]
DGSDHFGQLFSVYNQGTSANNDYAYVVKVGIDSSGDHGMEITIPSFDTSFPENGTQNYSLGFTQVTPDTWHKCVIQYTSPATILATDGAISIQIDPASGAASPQIAIPDGRFLIASPTGVGPFGRYGFGRSVGFSIDADGPDMYIDSIGSWDGFGSTGVNDSQAGLDFLNSSIPNLSVVATSATKAEGASGNTSFDFTVTRTGPTTVATTVDYTVTGSGNNAANNTDFGGTLPSGSVVFAIGETSKTISLNVNGDSTLEPDEGFTVTISVPSGGAIINVASASGTIQNDDQDYDFGDAPDPAYPTLLTSDGARHVLSGPFLGASRDADSDGQPNSAGTGDDTDGIDDEDGVTFPSLMRPSEVANITVVASSAGGRLNAWIDFNADGDWSDAGEQVFLDTVLADGPNALSFSTPSGATIGSTFARFRISTQTGLIDTGSAPDGEVEDYQITISANTTPVATAGSNQASVVGQPVMFTGMGSDADAGESLSYAWDYDYDGMTFNTDASTQVAGTAYTSPGMITAALRVTDGLGAFHIDTLTVTVSKSATATSITSDNPDHSNIGESVTINATVAITAPGSGTLSGNVKFFEGANLLGEVTLSGTTASLATTTLPAGTLSLTAQYVGDSNFATSTSGAESHSVNRIPTATAGGPSDSVVGETINLTGSGTDTLDGDTLSYAWDFDYDGMTFNANSSIQNPTTSYSSPGARTVALQVSDDRGASMIDSFTVTVSQATTTTSITSDNPDHSNIGESVTINATVAIAAPGAGTLTGTVKFFEGANLLGEVTLSGTTASLATTALPAGNLSLTAQYLGDSNFATSTSVPESHSVNRIPTASAGGPASAVVGETVNLTGSGTDTLDGDTLSYAWDFDYDGMTFNAAASTQNASTSYTSPGSRTIALQVSDDRGASMIDTLSISISKAATTTALSTNPSSSDFGQSVTLTANVLVTAPGSGTATGNVIFKSGSTTLATVTVNGSGEATHTTSTLAIGSLSLTAEYQGDSNFTASTSPSFPHTVSALHDFGDAPDPSYPTLLASNGARHQIVSGAPQLGTAIDDETDGQPQTNADGDDTNGAPDDEDGVTIPTLVAGTSATIQINVTVAAGKLDAWIDFNQDGDWTDPGEQVATDLVVTTGAQTLMVPIDQGSPTGHTFARFRISTAGALTPTGAATDGEVEDYKVLVISGTAPATDNIATPTPKSNGDVDIVFTGLPGVVYTVQASSDLSSGQPGWSTVATITADSNGTVFHTETAVGSQPKRFYRVFVEPLE